MKSTRIGVPSDGVLNGAKAIVLAGLLLFIALALAVTVAAFQAGGGYGLLWLFVGLPIAYKIGYSLTRSAAAAYLKAASPRSQEILVVAGSWSVGPWPDSPRGEGAIIAYPDGLRFDAVGASAANFELPWHQLESYGSQDYAVDFRLNAKPPWFCIITVKPENMTQKQAWLDLLESKQVPKAQSPDVGRPRQRDVAPAPESDPQDDPASSVRIFLVDRGLHVQRLLGQALSLCGFEVVGRAGSVDEAISSVHLADPQVVVVDNHVPSDGIGVARRMRASRPHQAIILYSGSLDETVEREAEEAGVARCVDKRDGLDTLEREIRRVAGATA